MCMDNRLRTYRKRVLIDTWWNVNQTTGISADPTAIGFNRYMVECELFRYGRIS